MTYDNSIKKIAELYDARITSTKDAVKAAGQWGSDDFVPLICKEICSKIKLKQSDTILELGCGTGVFTRHLLTMTINKLTLNDISPVMINTLKSRLSIPSNTKFLIGNAEKISLEKTDLICANAVFQWFLN